MIREFEVLLSKILEKGCLQDLKFPVKIREIDKSINIEISLFLNNEDVFCTRDDFTCLLNRFLAKYEYVLRRPDMGFVVNLTKQNYDSIRELFSSARQLEQDDSLLLRPIDSLGEKSLVADKNVRNIDFLDHKLPTDCTHATLKQNNSIIINKPFRTRTEVAESRPFLCGYRNCTSAFKRLEHLKRHTRIHTGERPFRCNFAGCFKRFARSDNLKQHLKVHNLYLITKRRK